MANVINWFEVPVTDLDRAAKFYSAVLGAELKRQLYQGYEHAFFPYEPGKVSGALVRDARRKPSADGALVYLHVPEIDAALKRAQASGGEVLLPKTDIGEHGLIAVLQDSEGNAVGLHTPRP